MWHIILTCDAVFWPYLGCVLASQNIHHNWLAWLLAFVSLASIPLQAKASDFQIIKSVGVVEVSSDQRSWSRAAEGQSLLPGTWLRTGPLSKVTLTLPDRTQTIIARNSEIQLSAPEGGQSTSINLNIGKLWSKTNKKPVALTIKAPNAVASIRGTEWVFDVSEDGESSVAVMEGFVAVNANDGAFSAVERGEIASVNKLGKISVSRILNPKQYLQFVFRYTIEPYVYLPTENPKISENLSQIRKQFWISNTKETEICSVENTTKLLEFFMRVSDLPTSCIASLDFAGLGAIGIENWVALLRAEASFAVGDVSNGKLLLASANDGASKDYVTAKLLFSQGEYKKALDILSPLKEVKTIAAFAHLMSGQIYEAMGLKSAALKEYYLSTQKEKAWSMPWLLAARLHLEFSNFDLARTSIELAEKLNGADIYTKASRSQYNSYRYQLSEARSSSAEVLELDPNNFEQLIALGIIELKSGKPEQALLHFTRASAIETNYARAYVFMAVAHLHLGELEQALTQLDRAATLDPNDAIVDVIASQIHSSQYNVASSLKHAREAINKIGDDEKFGQLANDQQGGANVARRYLEVGLLEHARKANLDLGRDSWAGTHFFNASTARSELERNSSLIKGFTIDSQAFGSRRDRPDVIARTGNYGYTERLLGMGEEKADVALKFGANGKEINGNTESSYLYDVGLFGIERDAYAQIDDTDRSAFALGFFGFGKRVGFDQNTFLTGNIVPFVNDSSYPVKDLTGRIDVGKSLRSDTATWLETAALESGDASFEINANDLCRGIANMKTNGVEYGIGEVDRYFRDATINWAVEGGVRTATSEYDVAASGVICDDLTETVGGNYQNLDEDVESLEYELLASAQINQKYQNITNEYQLRFGTYHRQVEIDLLADGVVHKDIRSDYNKIRFRPAFGTYIDNGKISTRMAFIRDYHPLRQAPLLVGDVAGIYPHYEFLNTGGLIDQASIQWLAEVSDKGLLSIIWEHFDVENNEVYLLFREQWNSDLLANFSLNRYYNANSGKIFDAKNRFAAGEFKRLGLVVEWVHSENLISKSGIENWSAKEVDHPRFDEASALGPIHGVPAHIIYTGLTRIFDGAMLSGRLKYLGHVYNKPTSTYSDSVVAEINYTQPWRMGELTLDMSTEYDDLESAKAVIMYRKYR